MKDFDTLKKEFEEGTIFQAGFSWEFIEPVTVEFEKWFVENGMYLKESIDLPNEITVIQTTKGQCFHNSQLVAIQNNELQYYEGIIYGPEFKNCLHHGFNFFAGETIDVTYISNKEDFHNEDYRDKYYIYFGVPIPNAFIEKYKERIGKANQQNPILFDYFNSLKG